MADFSAEDKDEWYVGVMSRKESIAVLENEKDNGVFLVRDSTTIKGDFVLCVKEDSKVAQYIINKKQIGELTSFKIGDQEFSSLPALLNFYKTHYLDITSLIRPAQKPKFIATHTFDKRDPDDLSFVKGEVLSLVRKDEDQWWTCRNARGEAGLVPANYITPYTESAHSDPMMMNQAQQQPAGFAPVGSPTESNNGFLNQQPKQSIQRTLPAMARVIRTRIPNAYDKSQLKLQVGDTVTVTAMHLNGQWEGVVNNQKGFFPFTHVKFLSELEDET